MNWEVLISNLMHAPVLFFFLGVLAVLVKSDLEIPNQISKFLGIYLLFNIGIKGGEHLYESGFSFNVVVVVLVCLFGSFLVPFFIYRILKWKFNYIDAGAVAAAYGSISAVTFVTATAFLDARAVDYGGYMVAGMALMESPAIIAGLILIQLNERKKGIQDKKRSFNHIIKEAFVNGSVFLLIGSMVIGYLIGHQGKEELAPFVNDIFIGMLCLYMLDMGLLAAKRMKSLRDNAVFAVSFGVLFSPVMAALSIAICYILNYTEGDALLQTILFASASYIAVPAAMRLAVPDANMSILLPMSLGVTFTFNISIGIPLYYFIIQQLW